MVDPASITSTCIFGLIGLNLTLQLITKTHTGVKTFIKKLCNDTFTLIDFANVSDTNNFFIQYNLFNLINSVNFPSKNNVNTYVVLLFSHLGRNCNYFNKEHIQYLQTNYENNELNNANLLHKKRKIQIPMEEIKISTKVKFTLNNVDIKKILTKKSTNKYASFLYKLKVIEWKNYNIKQKTACFKKFGGTLAEIKYLTDYYTTWKGFLGEGSKEKFDYFWSGYKGHYHNGLNGTKTPFEIKLEFYIIPYFKAGILSGYYFQTNKQFFGNNELLDYIIETTLKKFTDKITETTINFKSKKSPIEISELELI